MSALAAQSSEYVLIPGGNGLLSVISESQARSLINQDQDQFNERAVRFSELLNQRGAGHVPFWFTGSDVIIKGDERTAWDIHNVVSKLPHMMRSAVADNDNGHKAGTFADKKHIGAVFAGAADNPRLKAPDVGAIFKNASAYEAMTGNRLPRFGYRQTQHEGIHNRM